MVFDEGFEEKETKRQDFAINFGGSVLIYVFI